MGTSDRPGKGYTPPKGKHTTAQSGVEEKAPRVSATVEWVIVGIVLVGLLVVAFIFATRNDSTNPHGGAPAPVVEPLTVDRI